MKKIVVLAIIVLAIFISPSTFAKKVPNQFGLDWNTDGPKGKNWIKVTNIHYLNNKSIKKIKGSIYQARLCNEMKGPNGKIVWNYFNVRVDCKTKQAYSEIDGRWTGPANPTEEDNAVLKHACK